MKSYMHALTALKLENPFHIHSGIPMIKDSEFWQLYQYELRRQREHGLMDKANRKWLQEPVREQVGRNDVARVLGLESVAFPFVVLVAAGLASLVALALEITCRERSGLQYQFRER